MRVFVATILLAASAIAADQDFNGRWDITTTSSRVREPCGWN